MVHWPEHETYESTSDAWLRELTRSRRKQAREGKLPSWVYNPSICRPWFGKDLPETVRAAGLSAEFSAAILAVGIGRVRRRASYRSWRTAQWHKGVRNCYYCDVAMTLPHRKRVGFVCTPITATVDHKDPLGRGGADEPWNWVMCCSGCNNRKGLMTEAEFRTLMAHEASLAIEAA